MRDAMKPIEFTEDEWKAFGVENLHVDHFIKAGESYFQQTVEHKKEFKEDEWKAFGIDNLHMNHFIKSGESLLSTSCIVAAFPGRARRQARLDRAPGPHP